MRTSNPKRFYGKFRKRKKNVKNKISMDQFVDHFKNLISNDNVDNGPDTTDTMEVHVYSYCIVFYTLL
jgi:hypothetical protein